MKIKALSLWQPWASLVGLKTRETRSRPFHYRGPLMICSAKYRLPYEEVFNLVLQPEFMKALAYLVPKEELEAWGLLETHAAIICSYLPFGQALAICNLTDCNSTNGTGWMKGLTEDQTKMERIFGDFSPNRYALTLENIQRIKPFRVKGKQGLFDVEVPDSLLK